jgi:hypothetical protein
MADGQCAQSWVAVSQNPERPAGTHYSRVDSLITPMAFRWGTVAQFGEVRDTGADVARPFRTENGDCGRRPRTAPAFA